MNKKALQAISTQIMEKAKECGASLVGMARVEDLKTSPSHFIHEKLPKYEGIGSINSEKIGKKEVEWPENAQSAIVIAIEHPKDKPELDWWKDGFAGGTEGNRILISIVGELSEWLEKEKGMGTWKLPYHIEKGGIFLKDAAVLAGLGCIGKNNMVVTPEYGPRVRLRAFLTNKPFLSTGPRDFDPCRKCNMPCRKVCPQDAFKQRIYSEANFGLAQLPGRDGAYDRLQCNIQMVRDKEGALESPVTTANSGGKSVRYCRLCEFSCPVGRQ